MGGPYNIPRNYKGEDKILYIFSRKAFIYTAISAFIGIIIYFLLEALNLKSLGVALIIIFALIGFIVGTFKIPETTRFEFTRKLGGEKIDDVILRWIRFKQKNKRIYIYKEEESKDDK